MSTAAQITANRLNAQLSSGPVTETGKATSSGNALKTGLTGRTVLLPGDDAEHYSRLVTGFHDEYKPVGDEEVRLVQSLADCTWRGWRIPALETGIYALGRVELKDCFPEEADPAIRAQLIEAKIFLQYHRQLNNLSIQESRLRRQFDKDRKRLLELQDLRRAQARKQEHAAAGTTIATASAGNPGHAARSTSAAAPQSAIGFVFSDPESEGATETNRSDTETVNIFKAA